MQLTSALSVDFEKPNKEKSLQRALHTSKILHLP